MFKIAKNTLLLIVAGSFFCLTVSAQKKVAELTLVYDATISTGDSQPRLADAFDGATTTVYIKGTMSRSEMTSALASFTSIHDSKSGMAVVLQEISGQKLLIRMTADNWKDKNRRYEDISFSNTSETKTIAGYKCIKATATMKDGSAFTVYYTKDIIPENSDYNAQFKNLEGLPLEYELTQGKLKIKYTVSKINMNPVPASKFDIPKSGYRELTYEESRKLGIGG
jgi:GLPGLI family protein